jgi:hypothetical protein
MLEKNCFKIRGILKYPNLNSIDFFEFILIFNKNFKIEILHNFFKIFLKHNLDINEKRIYT